ncbi:Hypothetical protein POVR1_LOCUS286 [uncultured virus]|nr:Hypothetical protein POVR1_LOCUS286 [uncultured virus]
MTSNLALDPLIPNLSVNQLIDFYNTQRSWQQYLEDPGTLNALTKRFQMNSVNSFGEFVMEYDKKSLFRLCYDRYGTLDYIKCLISYIRDKNDYAFNVITDRYGKQIRSSKDLLQEAVLAKNEHAVHKLTTSLIESLSVDESSSLPGLLMRSLRYENPAIAIDLVTFIKRRGYAKNLQGTKMGVVTARIPPARIVSILRDKLLAEDTHSTSNFEDQTHEDRTLSLIWKLQMGRDEGMVRESIIKSLEDCDIYDDPEILRFAIRSGYSYRVGLILDDPRIKISTKDLALAESLPEIIFDEKSRYVRGRRDEILSLILSADQLDQKDVPDTLKDQYNAIISRKSWTLRRFQRIPVDANEDYNLGLEDLDNLPLDRRDKTVVEDESFRQYYVMTNYQLAGELNDRGVPVVDAIGHVAVAVLLSYLDNPSVNTFSILMTLLPICAKHQVKKIVNIL